MGNSPGSCVKVGRCLKMSFVIKGLKLPSDCWMIAAKPNRVEEPSYFSTVSMHPFLYTFSGSGSICYKIYFTRWKTCMA